MSMPEAILYATHAPLRDQVDTYITPDGEPGEDTLSLVCYTIERALSKCTGGMSKREYEVLDAIADFINDQGIGEVKRMDSFEDARVVGNLIEEYTEALVAGEDVSTLDFVELTVSDIAMCKAMAARRQG